MFVLVLDGEGNGVGCSSAEGEWSDSVAEFSLEGCGRGWLCLRSWAC